MELVLYDHPKKGLTVITREELDKRPGYRHQELEPMEKMDTMHVIRAIFPDKPRR